MKMPELKQSVFLRILSCIAIAGLSIGILCSVPTHVAFAADASDGSEFVTPQLEIAIPGVNLSSKQISVQKGSVQIGFLGAYINGIYNFLLGIVVITAAVMVVYGGFKYIIAATGADIQDGKERIKDAVLGLILVFASSTLLKVMNPSLGTLQPLTVQTVDVAYYSALATGDQPPTQYSRAATEVIAEVKQIKNGPVESSTGGETAGYTSELGAGGAGQGGTGGAEGAGQGGTGGAEGAGQGGTGGAGGAGGVDQSLNKNQGCGSGGYQPIKALCNSVEDCYAKYCTSPVRPSDAPPILAELEKTFVTFKGLPKDKKESQNQFGLEFMYGPDKTLISPDAKEALLKAGAIALKKGYYLRVGDVVRSFSYQVQGFCQRVEDSIKAGDKPLRSGGLALPGSSNHGVGIGVDISLKQTVNGKAKQLTPPDTVCNAKSNMNQVDMAVALGLQNVAILQDIMAQAGWKRLCSELWHFDYKGVYDSDCFKCAFPPKPEHGTAKGCKPKYVPPAN